jgi:hypothetical protein
VLITKKLQPHAWFSVIAGSLLDERALGTIANYPFVASRRFWTYRGIKLRANRGPLEKVKKCERYDDQESGSV